MARKQLSVEGMSCGGCEANVESEVSDIDGVESVAADNTTDTVEVEGDVDEDVVQDAIERAGYTVPA